MVRFYQCLNFLCVFLMVQSTSDMDIIINDLASNITSVICATNDTERHQFYKSMRDSFSSVHDEQYPVPDVSRGMITLTFHRAMSLDLSKMNTVITAHYDSFWYEINYRFQELQVEYFEWCIYLLSPDDIFGCIKGNQTWGSDQFRKLGLFDVIGPPPSFVASLFFNITHFMNVDVLQDALVVCSISVPWLNQNRTVGVFYSLELRDPQSSYRFTIFPLQSNAFLVAGEQKTFQTEIFITNWDSRRSGWFHNSEHVAKASFQNSSCTRPESDHYRCSNAMITHSIYEIDSELFSSCSYGEDFRNRKERHTLIFKSPSINDTGEFKFNTTSTGISPYLFDISRSFFVYVVFIKFPREVILSEGNPSTLSCVLKAPSNAQVYWLFDSQPIPSNCTRTQLRTEPLEGGLFSMFHSDLELCDISDAHYGEFSCAVDYQVPTGEQHTARVNVHVTTIIPSQKTPTAHQEAPNTGVYVGAAITTVFVIFLAVTVLFAVIILIRKTAKRRMRQTLQHRPSNHFLLKPTLSQDDSYINLCSPDIKKAEELEFPRQNLELLVELGQGKFGRVLKARVNRNVSSSLHTSIVAVKTTLNNGSFSENYRLQKELELLKKLHRQPHKNICNLLGHCTETHPLLIILEYACHGNLKKYLLSCSESLLSSGQKLLIDTTAVIGVRKEEESKFDQLQVISATNPLSIVIPTESLETDKLTQNQIKDSESLTPGQIKEAQLRDFACQISSGLAYLASMNIVHCDLAARNILIAEKGVLKISDFGMAREISGLEAPYQNLQTNQENVFPVKWAAPELLIGCPNTLKSDIWSFGVILWEVASYGSEPFSGVKLGAGLELFYKHLKEGNRLAKPAGLSSNLYQQMCNCWSLDPEQRPSAEDLLEFFQYIDSNTTDLEDILKNVTP